MINLINNVFSLFVIFKTFFFNLQVMKNDKASLSRYLILLNDLALYCNDWKEPDALKCLKVLPLDKCSVSVAHHNREIFSLHYQSLTLTLSCRDADMSIEWINIFEKTINQVSVCVLHKTFLQLIICYRLVLL